MERKGHTRFGFTIIEVTLFLAITGLMLASVMASTASMTQRRQYDDAVDGVVNFLRAAYSQTINVENIRHNEDNSGKYCTVSSMFNHNVFHTIKEDAWLRDTDDNNPGRTRCAVYGKLVTFGETYNSDGTTGIQQTINMYDVIGLDYQNMVTKEENSDFNKAVNDTTLSELARIGADVITVDDGGSGSYSLITFGTNDTYLPKASARIEFASTRGKIYQGAILIIRAPSSNSVKTYFYTNKSRLPNEQDLKAGKNNFDNDSTIEVRAALQNGITNSSPNAFRPYRENFLFRPLYNGAYSSTEPIRFTNSEDLYICVGSEDISAVGNQRDGIKIDKNGKNTEAVELLARDSTIDGSRLSAAEVCKK